MELPTSNRKTSYMYLACHAPIMDNPENNQHFSVLI